MTRTQMDAWFQDIAAKARDEGWDSPGVRGQLLALKRQENIAYELERLSRGIFAIARHTYASNEKKEQAS